MSVLDGKHIVLGVSGGIAAYKAAMVASMLIQNGANVDVIMTAAAQHFVQPLTFSAITHSAVHIDPFAPWSAEFTGHLSLASGADVMVIAPATANTLARLAAGLADDLLTLVALSTPAPLILAPAMEQRMYQHPATRENVRTLAERGATIIGPETGHLASGAVGEGRLAEPRSIVSAVESIVAGSRALQGKHVIVTAGGTREPLDPVRYLGNRSSGRMGYALAGAALAAGAHVTLISGPTCLEPPWGAVFIGVDTAQQMQEAVEQTTRTADLLIMAAAVSDFRPIHASERKIKKDGDSPFLDLHLVRNPDILADLDRPHLLKIGFAAETEHLLENAAHKLSSKGLAMIVANDAVETIGAARSQATLVFRDGETRSLPTMTKEALAAEIIRVAAPLLPVADGSP